MNKGLAIIRKYEGCRLRAYLCPANKWTIGWGNTVYEDGSAVKKGDVITQQRADALFIAITNKFAIEIRPLITATINDNQFGSLLSFAYNAGTARFRNSTLLRLVNANPNNPLIRDEFMKWNKSGGQVLNGLTRRRADEADLYFSKQ